MPEVKTRVFCRAYRQFSPGSGCEKQDFFYFSRVCILIGIRHLRADGSYSGGRGNSRLPVATVVKIVPPASHRGRGTTPECIPVVRPIRELTIEVLLLNAFFSGFCTMLANFIGRCILLLHSLDRYNRPEIQRQ